MKQKLLMMLMPLALAGCVTTPVYAPKISCADLFDGTWEEPVPDAAAPRQGETPLDTLKNWIGFAAEQTAGKKTEYERAQEYRRVNKRCEEMQRTAIEKSKPRFLGIF